MGILKAIIGNVFVAASAFILAWVIMNYYRDRSDQALGFHRKSFVFAAVMIATILAILGVYIHSKNGVFLGLIIGAVAGIWRWR